MGAETIAAKNINRTLNYAWKPLAAVCALVIGVYAYTSGSGRLESLIPNAADTYYNLLVRGFRDGQLSLKKEVPPGLAHLADPYDPAANAVYRSAPYYALHDLSYYKGRLYLYFGITPALILFWPFAALTGQYLFHRQAVAIFCMIGFLASAGLLFALWRRYFADVNAWVVVACALALGLATGVPMLLSAAEVYQVPISCGYMLTMLALAAIWRALHEPRRRSGWLAAASVAYGLAVGARPSLLLGAVILLAPVAQAWRERRQVWAVLIAAMGPILLIGLGLMLYNSLRFDSSFEFGEHYELAPGRAARGFFSLRYLWFNFRVYFLEPARWGSRFPFVHGIVAPPLPPGHGGIEKAFGILANVPLAWLALAAPLAWRRLRAEEGAMLRGFVMAVALLFGMCTLTLGFFWAAIFRYEADFLPALLLLAVVGILGLERVLAERPVWRCAARWGWSLLLGFSVAFNLFTCAAQRAEVHFSVGADLVQLGRVQEAIGQYQQALKIRPDYCEVHYNLGYLSLQADNAGEAITHLHEALRFIPGSTMAPFSYAVHFALGNALVRAGRVHEAIEQYEQALRFKPDYVEAHRDLALALEQTHRVREALAHYEQALRLMPDRPEVQNNLAWLLATLAPAEGGDPVRAVTLAEMACKLTNNQTPPYLDTLAAAYAAAGRFSDAVTTAQKAINLANSAGQPQVARQIEPRLKLYRRGQLYRSAVDATPPKS